MNSIHTHAIPALVRAHWQTVWHSLLLLLLLSPILHAAEQITYYHYDALGSPVAATDENGNLLWKETYEPYGKRLRKEDGGTNNNWYTGKQYDTSIGLSYFGGRWYDPSIGRFMAIDPAAINAKNIHSVNRYVYANNNPYKYVDPDGREIVPVGTITQKRLFNNALTVLKNSNAVTKSQVIKLQNSSNVHTLRFPLSGERPVNKTTGIRGNESNGIGTGSESIVDPTKSITISDQSGKRVTLSPESVIAHELLGHGLDKDRGVINRTINPSTGQKISEESAMKRANTYRRSVSEKERKRY